MENASLITIPQLSYRSLYQAVQTWLLGLNPRRIQAHLPLVAAFLAGVLWVRGAATCMAMSAGGVFSHDALNRLLIGHSLRGLLQMAALTMVKRTNGYLVIDDVARDKDGPKIAGIAWLYSSSLEQRVRALNVVVLGWTNGRVFIPLTFRFWNPPRSKEKGERMAFDGTPFKTKLELAAEMLVWARERGFTPRAVLFDAYYLAKPMLKFLKKAKWQWVSRVKSNRLLRIGRDLIQLGRWKELARVNWAPQPTQSVRCELPEWGSVRVIAVQSPPQKEPRYLIGSNPEWGRGRIIQLYGYRWDIEVAFRNTKQLAGLNDCQCRSFRAQENHVALVFLSYLFVLDQSKPAETAGTTLNRMAERQVQVAALGPSPKVRPIKLERRHHMRQPYELTTSRFPA